MSRRRGHPRIGHRPACSADAADSPPPGDHAKRSWSSRMGAHRRTVRLKRRSRCTWRGDKQCEPRSRITGRLVSRKRSMFSVAPREWPCAASSLRPSVRPKTKRARFRRKYPTGIPDINGLLTWCAKRASLTWFRPCWTHPMSWSGRCCFGTRRRATSPTSPGHQDGAYWPMTPVKTITAWVALGDVDRGTALWPRRAPP